jgi:hypothetical protein
MSDKHNSFYCHQMTKEQLLYGSSHHNWNLKRHDIAECPDESEMKVTIGSLRAAERFMQPRATDDNPINDATDAAHPAWWRAHDYTTEVFCREVNAILDGKPETGGISTEPWQSLKVRLHQSRTTSALLEKAMKAIKFAHECFVVIAEAEQFTQAPAKGAIIEEIANFDALLTELTAHMKG